MSAPNIILITTDQQRYDTIGSLGYPYARTPHLDALISSGVCFEHCYCSAPTCVPSRASFFNAVYPHALGVYNGSITWEHSWVERFREAGYDTVNIGKMHTVPFDARCGFDQRLTVENKDRPHYPNMPHGGFFDELDKFILNTGLRKPSRVTYRTEYPGYETALGAYEWPLDDKYHPDVFVGNMCEWFVTERRSNRPFFLKIGFPGPHPPYDPTSDVRALYADMDIPIPQFTEEEKALQPPPHAMYRREMITGNHDAVRWREFPEPEHLLRLRRYYMANVTLIDKQIGTILSALEDKEYLDNAVIIYTSDHGDCLGDHGHIQKWTMYDSVMRVPTVVSAPGRLPQGKRVDELVQQLDLVPMLFDLAGLPPLSNSAGVSALEVMRGEREGRDAVFAEQGPNDMMPVEFMTMMRSRDWKLVHYLGQDTGELYDLRHDPEEVRNLWNDADYKEIRADLIFQLLEWCRRESYGKCSTP